MASLAAAVTALAQERVPDRDANTASVARARSGRRDGRPLRELHLVGGDGNIPAFATARRRRPEAAIAARHDERVRCGHRHRAPLPWAPGIAANLRAVSDPPGASLHEHRPTVPRGLSGPSGRGINRACQGAIRAGARQGERAGDGHPDHAALPSPRGCAAYRRPSGERQGPRLHPDVPSVASAARLRARQQPGRKPLALPRQGEGVPRYYRQIPALRGAKRPAEDLRPPAQAEPIDLDRDIPRAGRRLLRRNDRNEATVHPEDGRGDTDLAARATARGGGENSRIILRITSKTGNRDCFPSLDRECPPFPWADGDGANRAAARYRHRPNLQGDIPSIPGRPGKGLAPHLSAIGERQGSDILQHHLASVSSAQRSCSDHAAIDGQRRGGNEHAAGIAAASSSARNAGCTIRIALAPTRENDGLARRDRDGPAGAGSIGFTEDPSASGQG